MIGFPVSGDLADLGAQLPVPLRYSALTEVIGFPVSGDLADLGAQLPVMFASMPTIVLAA